MIVTITVVKKYVSIVTNFKFNEIYQFIFRTSCTIKGIVFESI